MLSNYFENQAPPFRVRYNVSVLIDIPNGPIMTGPNGESYYGGGLAPFGGITARGNTFKSTLGQFISKRALARYDGTLAIDYDTEETIDIPRINSLTENYTGLSLYDLQDEKRYSLVNKANYLGNDFFKRIKDMSAERTKKVKPKTIPFVYKSGGEDKQLKKVPPLIVFTDSFSQLTTESVEKIQDKSEVGASERNTEALRDAAAKDQMVRELSHVTERNNFIFLSVAHMGEKHQLDPRTPPMKQFAHLKQGFKLKNVPEKYTFLTTNLWAAISGSVLNNDGTKSSEYPAENEPEIPGDTDLNLVHYFDLRSKGGSSGISVPFIFSQRYGFLEGVTMWHLLKSHKQWGMIKGHHTYATYLYPDVFAGRKQVRRIMEEDPMFLRALELTAEARLLEIFHPDIYFEIFVPIEELRERIIDRGYDWDRILSETRYYWVWEEDAKAHPKKPLTMVDVFKMARGLYHPKWYGPVKAAKAEDLSKALDDDK